MRLLFGTGNPAKLESMRRTLAALPLEVVGLVDLPTHAPKVPENGSSPMDNARQKAWAYYETFHMPVFSCDSGLFIEGLPPERQPGVHVRWIGGRELSDAEMLTHYASVARELGGRAVARYRNAICLILDAYNAYEQYDERFTTNGFLLCDTPHAKVEPGFPLDSLSLDLATGAYFYDVVPDSTTEAEAFHPIYDAYCDFFRYALRLK